MQTSFAILDSWDTGLKLTARCYSTDQSVHNTGGLTLLLTHCIGAHKEQWEPTIERILSIQHDKDPRHRIREAWSLDWQNHGDAAVLNREALRNRPEGISVYEWAKSITSFVCSPRMKDHRIVAIGHSAGAGANMLSTKSFILSNISNPYKCMILVEPAMVTKELFNATLEDRMFQMDLAVRTTSVRRDTWESRQGAFEWFMKRFPWNTWDSRVVRIFADHGLQDCPDGVTLKCDRMQEAVSYPDKEGHFEATDILARICRTVPIHLVWGDRNDLIPEVIQESLCDASEGRIVSSVTKVEDAGHMIVQEQPDRLAEALCAILDTIPTYGTIPPSRL